MTDIRISGDVQRSFIFPAEIGAAFAFYADIRRLTGWLKHIALVRNYSDNQMRLMYHTVELGIYGVSLYCDASIHLDPLAGLIQVHAMEGKAPVASRATLHSLTAQGIFRSESVFHARGDATRIDYHLHLEATLPTPLAAQILIPRPVLGRIAQSIAEHRIDEIADVFIQRSLAAFREQKER